MGRGMVITVRPVSGKFGNAKCHRRGSSIGISIGDSTVDSAGDQRSVVHGTRENLRVETDRKANS